MSSLQDLLAAQLQAICDLETLLGEETQAIAYRKSDDIQACAKRKLTLLNQIKQGDTSISQCSEISEPSDEHREKIDEIKKLLSHCHQLNETNGDALKRAHLSMHKLRNMFQEAAGRFEMTYDSEGQASGSKTLGTNVKA
ncbi:flagella synthesis protein FlgN [Veronia nyctiphanis]|nr:flagellar export chaperone FlgN [Veronia nyctiphanis]